MVSFLNDWIAISTNTLLTEGDLSATLSTSFPQISTNTLLTEGDLAAFLIFELVIISTNTLLTEGDEAVETSDAMQKLQFQPTPSSRRVTGWLFLMGTP